MGKVIQEPLQAQSSERWRVAKQLRDKGQDKLADVAARLWAALRKRGSR